MDFKRSYEVLGLQPGSTWAELQIAYRRQVQKWHPDRFEQRPEEQVLAAQRMQDLNEAFAVLEQYYREQGRLPLEPPPHKPGDSAPPPKPDYAAQRPRTTRRRREPSSAPHLGPWVLAAALLGIGIYFLLDLLLSGYNPTAKAVSRPSADVPIDTTLNPAYPTVPGSKPAAPRKPPLVTFGYGDPPGRVLEVQGIPTRTAGDLWFYGDSEVYFEKGMVVSWHSSPRNPLNVSGASKSKSAR